METTYGAHPHSSKNLLAFFAKTKALFDLFSYLGNSMRGNCLIDYYLGLTQFLMNLFP